MEFDPDEVSYVELVDRFWGLHDPTQVNRQGWDVGTQYRSAIFTHSPEQAEAAASKARAQLRFPRPIATEIVPATTFWPAEDYHQQYLVKNGRATCRIGSAPAPRRAGARRSPGSGRGSGTAPAERFEDRKLALLDRDRPSPRGSSRARRGRCSFPQGRRRAATSSAGCVLRTLHRRLPGTRSAPARASRGRRRALRSRGCGSTRSRGRDRPGSRAGGTHGRSAAPGRGPPAEVPLRRAVVEVEDDVVLLRAVGRGVAEVDDEAPSRSASTSSTAFSRSLAARPHRRSRRARARGARAAPVSSRPDRQPEQARQPGRRTGCARRRPARRERSSPASVPQRTSRPPA